MYKTVAPDFVFFYFIWAWKKKKVRSLLIQSLSIVSRAHLLSTDVSSVSYHYIFRLFLKSWFCLKKKGSRINFINFVFPKLVPLSRGWTSWTANTSNWIDGAQLRSPSRTYQYTVVYITSRLVDLFIRSNRWERTQLLQEITVGWLHNQEAISYF